MTMKGNLAPQKELAQSSKSALNAPTQCAYRGRAEDAAAGALEMAQILQRMDGDVIRRMVQAREAALSIRMAFPEGDQRFKDLDDDDDDDDIDSNNEFDNYQNTNRLSGVGFTFPGKKAEEVEEQNVDDGELCIGLFDDVVDNGPCACLRRVKDSYDFDIVSEMDSARLNMLQRIRVVNWIRKLIRLQQCSPAEAIMRVRTVLTRCGEDAFVLDDDALLVPLIPGDVLLTVLESRVDENGGTLNGEHEQVENGDDNDEDNEDVVRKAVLQSLYGANLK